MAIESHRDLDVWKKAMLLVDMVYTISRTFHKEEQFGLIPQLRRAAVSVPCNIAEGHGRATRKDYAGFIAIAKGPLHEAETLMLIAIQQGFLGLSAAQPSLALVRELERMLSSLRSKLISSVQSSADSKKSRSSIAGGEP